MITLKITDKDGKLTNECPFVVTFFLDKEMPIGVRVGSNACRNCVNCISKTESEVTCKGEKLLRDIYGNVSSKPITPLGKGELVGRQFTKVAIKDDYIILEQRTDGYLIVQPSALRRAGLDGGKEMMHKSEIDGVNYKFH